MPSFSEGEVLGVITTKELKIRLFNINQQLILIEKRLEGLEVAKNNHLCFNNKGLLHALNALKQSFVYVGPHRQGLIKLLITGIWAHSFREDPPYPKISLRMRPVLETNS